MNPKEIIDGNDFLIDLIKLEAKELLRDLKNEYLYVVLLPAPYPIHPSHKIRKAISFNPEWYRNLYWKSGETWKRNHTIKFLKQISHGILNFDSKYVQELLYLILSRLGVI